MTGRAFLGRALVSAALALAASAARAQADPSFDLFLKSDYGSARIWINTATGEFRWLDAGKGLDLRGKGELAFPNLGPVVFAVSGEFPGYDWVSATLKIYGTTATGYLAAFPSGEKVRKVTSNFFDRNTRDDLPKPRKGGRALPSQASPPPPKPPPPSVGEIRATPPEVPKG
ncbi:MAG: hypothetical protein AB1347_00720 [Acidobacteriota bacterium]